MLPTHVACAFGMPVEHTFPQAPQLFTLVLVSTQLPSHSSGASVGHPDRQVEPEHTGLPASAEHACPQEPQFVLSLVVSTQDPPHAV
jgi:hypothetical protein